MIRPLLVRGMLAGLAAGVVAFVLGYLFGEGPLSAGIAYEEAGAPAAGMAESEGVSRTVQSTLGLGVVSVLLGVALGGLFGLAFALAQGRLGALGPRATAMVVAVAAYVGTFAVPQLKYPANPPGVNSGDTVGARTTAYLALLVLGVVVTVAVVWLARRWAARFGSWDASLLAILAGAMVVAIAYLALPGLDETPPDFPATVMWQFRVASFGIQAAMWATIGLVFGAMTERAMRASGPLEEARTAPAAG